MNKLILFSLLLLSGCYQHQANLDLVIEVNKCYEAGLRAIGLHNPEGKLVIQCRPHKKEET